MKQHSPIYKLSMMVTPDCPQLYIKYFPDKTISLTAFLISVGWTGLYHLVCTKYLTGVTIKDHITNVLNEVLTLACLNLKSQQAQRQCII